MKTLVSLLVIFNVSVSLCGQQKAANGGQVLAITHVAVVDTTGGSVKRDKTVIIVDGRIAAIGTSRTVRIPKGAQLLVIGAWLTTLACDT